MEVFETGVECPVCQANTAHTNLEIHTNEREWDCERCGFHSHTRIVARAGKSFWEHTMEMPMSANGKVAWPELQPVPRSHWSAKEFGTMPGFDEIPEDFGVEEAKD